jgi:hypothetical protein
MGETPVSLPALSAEENNLVERVVDASAVIVPTVQVSLAKRIVQAGTNRVICLGASTSVPLHDDELASVSDLALRLSDGTNVVMSLSFFNDAFTGTFVPLERSVFDANRYVVKDDSKLNLVIVITGVIACLWAYSLVHNPWNRHWQSHPIIRATLLPSQIIMPIKPAVKNDKVAPAKPRNVSSLGKVRESGRIIKFPKLAREMMFVPPPPVIFNAPLGAEFFPVQPSQMLIPSGHAAKLPAKKVQDLNPPPSLNLPKAHLSVPLKPSTLESAPSLGCAEAHNPQAVSGLVPLPGEMVGYPELERIKPPPPRD